MTTWRAVLVDDVSVADSANSHEGEPQLDHPDVQAQLKWNLMLKQNEQLMSELLASETRYNQLLTGLLSSRKGNIKRLEQVVPPPPPPPPPPLLVRQRSHSSQSAGAHGQANGELARSPSTADRVLVQWLAEHECSNEEIHRIVNVERYTKEDLLEQVERADLLAMEVRGGIVCRLWRAIQMHRASSSSVYVTANASMSKADSSLNVLEELAAQIGSQHMQHSSSGTALAGMRDHSNTTA